MIHANRITAKEIKPLVQTQLKWQYIYALFESAMKENANAF